MFSASVVRTVATFAVLILVASAHSAVSDPQQIVALSLEVQRLIKDGRPSEAIPVAERVVALSEVQFGKESAPYATALNRLAQAYRATARWDEAEKNYKLARTLRERHDKQKLTDTLNDLGLLYLATGRFGEAEPLLKQAVADYTARYGADNIYVATASANLGLLYRSQGRYAEAEQLMQRALDIRRSKRGPDHLEVANSLSNLAGLYRDQKRYAEAEVLVTQALAIRQKQLGPDSPQIASSLNILGEIYRAQGRYALAEDAMKKALAIRRRAYPANHPSIATALNSLGNNYEDQGQLAPAEKAYKESLAVQEKTARADNPELATGRANLGALYKSQKRYAEAEILLRQALDVRERVLDTYHPDLVASLILMGELCREQGKADEAQIYFDKARSRRRASIRDVRVYFATNRQRDPKAADISFGGDRAESVTTGFADIWVPVQNKPPRPSKRELSDDITSIDETTAVDRLVIQRTSIIAEDALIKMADDTRRSARISRGEALVFVHGFNVSFANALRRTAQIAYDLNFDGPVFLFTWPSRGGNGTLKGLLSTRYYPYDRESADLSVQYLLDFITGPLAKTGASKIHFIAHSMGNRPMLEALERIKLMGAAAPKFAVGEVVLASPDVEVGRFKQLVAAVGKLPAKMTLYASTRDRALRASQWVWGGGARAGYVTDEGPFVTSGVDSIDVSTAGANPFDLNHDVYVANPAIFKDMRVVLENGLRPPDQRTHDLKPIAGKAGTYWTFGGVQ